MVNIFFHLLENKELALILFLSKKGAAKNEMVR